MAELFTVEETEKLIALWATEEVLYNCKNAKYFNKDSIAAALKRVLEKLEKEGLTMAELHKKMACLRTYYGIEFGKEKASAVSGTGGNSLYTSKWPFFTTLHFLSDNITPRKTTSTASSIEIVDEDVQEESGVISVESQVENTPDVKCVFNTTNPPTSLKSKRKLKMSLEDELSPTCLEELKRPKTEMSSNQDSSFEPKRAISPTWKKVTRKRKRNHDLNDNKQKRIKTPEDPGYLYSRKEALELYKLRDENFKKAAVAFSQKQGQLAQSSAAQGHALTEEITEANKRTASSILKYNNADNDEFNLDLHGLYVSEALEALQERLDHLDFTKKAKFISVVTGKGSHSKQGKAKIKPAVLKHLQDKRYRYEEMDHGGQIKIYLKK